MSEKKQGSVAVAMRLHNVDYATLLKIAVDCKQLGFSHSQTVANAVRILCRYARDEGIVPRNLQLTPMLIAEATSAGSDTTESMRELRKRSHRLQELIDIIEPLPEEEARAHPLFEEYLSLKFNM